jgi:hypothetical protein
MFTTLSALPSTHVYHTYGEKTPQGVGTSCQYSLPRAAYYCAESKGMKGVGGTALGVDGGKIGSM